MGFTQEEFNNIVKFLGSEAQRGTFVLDEYVVIGSFWEDFKKNIKDENYDLDSKQLDVLIKILNACLSRKGNDTDVLRTVLNLLDKCQTLKDLAVEAEKKSSEPKIEEVK